ncbi:MAG: hypothetical protein MI724_04865 [Spirochaetales bacterium]|nr:hypothetical protein [Spirochaetales bacterium]
MADEPRVVKIVRRDRAYFRIVWSPLLPVSRWEINAAVPSVSGIWELYHLVNARVPRIIKLGRAWYGGLRNEIRAESDPTLPQNSSIKSVLEEGDCYYRYTICETSGDLTDLYSVLVTHRRVTQPHVLPTGRYREVRIQEPDVMEIRRVRRPHEASTGSTHMGNRVPNMFDVVEELRRLEAEGNDDEGEEERER